MKHHDARRPVGRCKGCCLNLKTLCAAGFQPKIQIRHGSCSRYNDAALLETVLNRPQPEGVHQARAHRRQAAARKASQPHYNGKLAPRPMRATAAQFR